MHVPHWAQPAHPATQTVAPAASHIPLRRSLPLPAALHPLTNLRCLFLHDTVRAGNEREASAALLALPRLTQLCFRTEDDYIVLPQAVG